MYRLITVFLLFIFTFHLSYSQSSPAKTNAKSFGVSAQFYPAGIIGTITMDKFITETSSLFFRTGVNLIERKDYSPVNDYENGNGLGVSAGYRKHFFLHKGQILAAFNLDVWNEWIHWANNFGQPDESSGITYTLVLQPWLETGYFTKINKASIQYGITAGFGREINVITDGNDVAQGWILSLLLHFQYTFTTHS